MLDDLAKADRILTELGYRREFHSENVSHYRNPDDAWGRIDLLHAFRGPRLGMLRRADCHDIGLLSIAAREQGQTIDWQLLEAEAAPPVIGPSSL